MKPSINKLLLLLASGCFSILIMANSQSFAQESATVEENAVQTPICDANDPTYKKVGGRNLCKRECCADEIGPQGNICESKEDPGTGEPFCDCGV